MKKRLLYLSGWLAMIVAGIGIFLPLVPTTPLVLLAAACFSCSSEKMHRILLRSRIFGPYIENYKNKQGISVGAKARAITALWLLLCISAVITRKLWLAILLAAVGVAVTIHLLLLKTKLKQNLPDSAPGRGEKTE